MKVSSISSIAVVLTLGPTLCYPQQAQPAEQAPQATPATPAPPRDTSPEILDVQGGKIRVVTVASACSIPGASRSPTRALSWSPSERRAAHHSRRRAAAAAGVGGAAASRPADNGLHFIALHPQLRREPARLPLVSETRRQRNTLAVVPRPLRRHDAGRREGNLRRRRLGDGRQPGRAPVLRPGRDAVRHGRRSRSHLLQRAQPVRTVR